MSADNQPARKSVARKLVLLSLTLVCLAGVFLAYQGLDSAKERANREKCHKTLRSIGQVIQLYMADNQQPPGSFNDLVKMCDLSPEILMCPSTADNAPKTANNSYVYVASGQTLDWMNDYSHILIYENPKNHQDGGHVLFADGRVDWLPSPELSTLISELEAGFNPPRGKGNPPATGPAENQSGAGVPTGVEGITDAATRPWPMRTSALLSAVDVSSTDRQPRNNASPSRRGRRLDLMS